jgi:tetratricopeptide (TPR) repeat protein
MPIRSLALLLLFWQGDAYQRGVAAFEQGRLAEALSLLQAATTAEPQNAQAWKALGVLYASQGDTRAAVDPFARACSLNSRLLDACYYHGRALYTLNRFDEAIPSLERALDPAKVKSMPETAIGECLEGLGRRDEAEKRFLAAIARRDDFEERARTAYARFLLRDGRATASVPMLEAAIARAPNSAEAHYQLGRALQQLDRLPASLTHLERAVALDPRRPAARLLLARVLRRLGRSGDAAAHEQAAAQLQGSSIDKN